MHSEMNVREIKKNKKKKKIEYSDNFSATNNSSIL
jgi:hypothetical protein